MGFKAVEITCNINNAFGPGTAKEHTVQWWFKKFCKGDESLEDEEHSGWPLEVDNHQLTAIIEADPLRTTQEVAEEFNTDHSMVIQHLKQIGKVKKLNRWVPDALTTNKKIIILNCHFLLFCATIMNHFSIGLWHATKSGFYMISSDDQLSGWTKKELQSQTCTKKCSWSLIGGLLPV